jgi:integrase
VPANGNSLEDIMGKLTDVQLKAWIRAGTPIAGKSDGDGLTFTLSKVGVASWVFRYRLAGKGKELTLGRYPHLTLTKARELAAAKRVQVQQTIDVASEKQKRLAALKQAGTVKELADLWLDKVIRRKHKHPEVAERVINKDILPALGKKDPKSVTRGEVARLLAKIDASDRPTVANDALRYIKAMFDYGESLGLVDRSPAEKIKIEHAGGKEEARNRALSQSELSKLFMAIRKADTSFGRDNQLSVFLLLTLGCRKMELFAAKWSELDLEACIWRIPANRTKTGVARELPLPSPVIDWLIELQVRACSSEFVFPARRTCKRYKHVGPDTLWRALKDLDHGLEDFTVHDFRRTARSLMADIGVPFDVAEKILGHKLPGSAAIYDRGGAMEQQRKALEKLAALIVRLESGNTESVVTPLRMASLT